MEWSDFLSLKIIFMTIKYIKIIITILMISGMGMACQQIKEDIVEDGKVVNISLDSMYSIKSIYIKEIIPLETNDISVIGGSRKVIEHDEKYYVLDYRERNIKVFDEQGEYLDKIGNIGQGVHEYISLQDININPYSNSLDILDPRGKLLSLDLKTHQYNPDIIIPSDVPQFSNFYWINPEIMVTNSSFQDVLLRFYNRSKDAIVKQSLKSLMVPTPAGGFFDYYPFWKFGNEINYLDEHSVSIYKIRNFEVEKRLRFDFGRHHFNYEEIKDNHDKIENLDDYLTSNEKAFPVINCFENEEYIGIGIMFKRGIHYFLTDKKTDEVFILPIGKYAQNFMDSFAFAPGLNVGEFQALVHNPVMFEEIFPDAELDEELRLLVDSASQVDNPWIVHYEVR